MSFILYLIFFNKILNLGTLSEADERADQLNRQDREDSEFNNLKIVFFFFYFLKIR